MFPSGTGQPQKDWMQILIAVVWLTVVMIMLLAKMKAVQDCLVLGFLLIATGCQNSQMLLPWLFDKGGSKRVEINLIALKGHLKWEAFLTTVISLVLFGVVNKLKSDWIYYGWLYQMVTVGIHLFSRNNRWHLNPVISCAIYGAVASRKALTYIQLMLYIGFQVAGMTMGFLLHSAMRSHGEDLSFFHTLEMDLIAVIELFAASVIGYGLTWAYVKRKEGLKAT